MTRQRAGRPADPSTNNAMTSQERGDIYLSVQGAPNINNRHFGVFSKIQQCVYILHSSKTAQNSLHFDDFFKISFEIGFVYERTEESRQIVFTFQPNNVELASY